MQRILIINIKEQDTGEDLQRDGNTSSYKNWTGTGQYAQAL
jgi:outer membrane protein assembly factor BamA